MDPYAAGESLMDAATTVRQSRVPTSSDAVRASSSSPPSSHTSPAGLAAEPVRVMTCCKCGNGLESDLGAAAELAAYGYVGTRWYCRLGCPQPRGGWMMTHADGPQPTVAPRGRYGHEAREEHRRDKGPLDGTSIPSRQSRPPA